ncbi:hypothetical protein D6C84_01839 [Aureobasidium pullulans]|uniref:Uncharacterized protein n=2 Tax=Aureobasidium pullulans TaxID=5580 RepID=A0A074XFU7_AURPU|nr:uncharacterized protein M438DRAFT_368119 [Aureobasidium pullulans EXF-150]KAG2168970.1 hypothetical protein JADG_008709 [Aureobasidium pullulans]KEQ80937.1 hypothetical protein M438DRAFT_368119 [Aureobasidium pullulans EXF-150]OBW65724.1 MAG: Pkinase-domain-containing protein [Aureobasidium pullulans]THV67271.1 hypothetical protein D6D28_07613 [Aureobasidium pullulans]THV81013.1 hypothetical protein D6D29_05726 [Aureobasidium pullulans]
MGWFGSDKSNTPEAPKATADGGFIAPDRTKRAHCWEARDGYFACLDKNNIIDSVREGEKADKLCAQEAVKFDQNCASSWVQYFKKRRVMEYQRDQTLKRLQGEGASDIAVQQK